MNLHTSKPVRDRNDAGSFLFTLVFGELVPKRIAQKKPEKIAKKVAGVIRFCAAADQTGGLAALQSTNGVLRCWAWTPRTKPKTSPRTISA